MTTPTCSRTGCNDPAVVCAGFDTVDRLVWFDLPGRGGAALLCSAHAERLVPPRGWILRDRRGRTPRLWVEQAQPTVLTSPGETVARRVPAAPAPETEPLPFAAAPEPAPWSPRARPRELERVLDAKTPLLARAFSVVRERDAS